MTTYFFIVNILIIVDIFTLRGIFTIAVSRFATRICSERVFAMLLSTSARTFPASGVRLMFEKAKRFDDAINLCIGEPGFITPEHIIRAGCDNLLKGKTKYTPNAGIPALREALAEKLLTENGISCNPDKNIIVTAGATQALMLCILTLVDPGDEIIFSDPAWPDYLGQVLMASAKPVRAAVGEDNGFKMTADRIEPLITPRTKLILLNSPNNPTGAMLTADELEAIADMVRRRKVFIISDEPYEHLVYDGNRHFSLGALPGLDDYLVTINSFSKTYAMTGWRVGYACANAEITANMVKLHENMIASINEAFQLAAIEALKAGAGDVERMRASYERNRSLVVERLNAIRGISCRAPQGAFYAFPNVKGLGADSYAVADMILEKTHVVTTPGAAFGPGGEGYLRISYANDYESLEVALERLEKAFGRK